MSLLNPLWIRVRQQMKKRLKPWIDRIGVKRTLFSCRSIRQLIFFLAWLNRAFCLFLGSREQKRLVVMFCQCVCEPTSVNRHHHKMWFFCTSVREPTSVLPFLPLEYECQWLPTTCNVIIIKLIFFKIMIMITSSSDLLIIEPEVKASIVPLSWQPRILHPNPPWSQSGWSQRKLAGWWIR